MSDLRRIKALPRQGLTPAARIGDVRLEWVALDRLVVNRDYQRLLSERSNALIRRGVENFSWSRFKALNVAARDDDRFEVIDGQHSAVILLTHGGFDRAPCLITAAGSSETLAKDFVGLNTARVGVTQMQKFTAALAAGDTAALAAHDAAKAAGVVIRRSPAKGGKYKPGETVAVADLQRIAARSVASLTEILTVCANARFAPIKALHLKAVDELLHDPALMDGLTLTGIAEALRDGGDRLADEADARRLDTGAPLYRQYAVEIGRAAR